MAVQKIETFLYVGLSGDVKPAGAPADTRFIETDTGKLFAKADDGNYYDITAASRSVTTGATADRIQGNSPTAAADVGDPVKIGGKYLSAGSPLLTDAQRSDAMMTRRAELMVTIANDTNIVSQIGLPNTDGVSVSNNRFLGTINIPHLFNGLTVDRLRTPLVFKPLAAVAIGAEATIWTPAAGKKFRLMGLIASVSAAVSIILKDNTGGTTIFQVPKLVIDQPFFIPIASGGNGILSAAANNVLTALSSAAANITGTVFGTEE